MAKKVGKQSGGAPGAPARSSSSGPRAPRGRVREVEVRADASDSMPPPPRVTFEDVIGQGRALEILGSAITSGRLHHAWIFHGPRGVGKLTTALAFAGAILDPTTGPGLSGGVGPAPGSTVQRLLAAGTHPDLHVISKELARFSEDRQVRERKLLTIPKDVIDTHLLRPAALAPGIRDHGLAGKVFIVDEAELLDRSVTNATTQNAILKTLEEPPPGTVIVLVTSAEDRLLPTIRSRCQRVAFSRLTPPEMKAWMARAGVVPPPRHAEWLLGFAEGSPGALLDAVTADLGAWRERLEPLLSSADAGAYCMDLGPAMAELIDQYAEAQVERSRQASKEAANHEGARLMFRVLAWQYRTSMRAAGAGPGAEAGARAIDAILIAERQLSANVRISDVAEDLSIRLSEAGAGVAVGDLA